MKNLRLFEEMDTEIGAEKPKQKNSEKTKTPILDAIGKDLTKLAAEEKLEPVQGREEEIQEVLLILGRKTKNNPVIIGEPGVGKTAIVEGIAQMIASKKCPRAIQGKRIIYVDMGSLIAGASKQGEFEMRIKSLLEELEKNKDILLFIDEIHMMVNPNMSIDAANMFKPALARGDMRLIGATTLNEFRNSIEKDGALDRRFQKVIIEEPTNEQTLAILNRIKSRYEDYHLVKYTDDAILACVKLSGKYITDRFFPDKAIDLMDEVGSKARLLAPDNEPEEIVKLAKKVDELKAEIMVKTKAQDYQKAVELRQIEKRLSEELADKRSKLDIPKVEVNKNDVAKIISKKIGVPAEKITSDEGEKLLKMEDDLKLQIIGQDEAVSKISKCIRRSRAGLRDPKKPAVFLFLGSTGTGKCHGRGTKILMYDGSIKNVEDIKVGDQLMGDDSKPRNVLSLATGKDNIYKIKYKSGSFTCNSEHILSLKETGKYNIINIPLNEYLKKNKTFKHTHKLWSTKVEFEESKITIDPYMIGLWLGDGDKNRVSITTADSEIVNYLENTAKNYNLKVYKNNLKNNKSDVYCLTGENWTNNKNELLNEFRNYGLIDKNKNYTKFIPDIYLHNSIENRKKLLSGLIDSDGYISNNCYLITTKYSELADQIVYLCKSLGYMATKSKKDVKKYPKNTYYNINISGDFDLNSYILLDRKKHKSRNQKKNVNLFSFDVEHIGYDDYFGFELDGNHLYLLQDFVVTHNTHTVKTLAKYLFGSEDAMIRFDMSEYGEKHNVSRLIGSPPGYVGYGEGGQLTEKVRRKPYCIILLDELEKAHPEVLNVLLQVFDDGQLTDGQGRKVNFKNTIIIMTSNIGSSAVKDMRMPMGFNASKISRNDNMKDLIKKELKKRLAPEFINRIDDIIIFSQLPKESIYKIIDIEINKLSKRVEDMGYHITITDNVRKLIMDNGYDEEMGARPLKRAIETLIEDPISEEILRGAIKDAINVDYDPQTKNLSINGNVIKESLKFIKKFRMIIEKKFQKFKY